MDSRGIGSSFALRFQYCDSARSQTKSATFVSSNGSFENLSFIEIINTSWRAKLAKILFFVILAHSC
jgi:hypothetical protein